MAVVAVSGGIDSRVLLDILWRCWRQGDGNFAGEDLTVAHFNHGTRPSADADAEFVRKISADYGVKCVVQKVELGTEVSEDVARKARYDFLREVAGNGRIFTAQHLDDLVESVAINFWRGTGLRGLTPFSDPQIVRPFLEMPEILPKINGFTTGNFVKTVFPWSRREILLYAQTHGLTWRQDPTNFEPRYLRNRLREKCGTLSPEKKLEIFALFQKQKLLRQEIERTVAEILPEILTETKTEIIFSRKFFNDDVAEKTFFQQKIVKSAGEKSEDSARNYNFATQKNLYWQKNAKNVEKNYKKSAENYNNVAQAVKNVAGKARKSQKKFAENAEKIPKKLENQQKNPAEADKVFLEILRAVTLKAQISATRPQLANFLQAIRVYAPGKRFNLPGGRWALMRGGEVALERGAPAIGRDRAQLSRKP